MEKIAKITVGKVMFHFPNLFKPTAREVGEKENYNMCVIINKKDKANVAKIKAAISSVAEYAKKNTHGGKLPRKWAEPLHDGDEEKDTEKYPEFANTYYLNAKANIDYKPKVVDKNFNEILDKDEIYAGCFGAVSLRFYAYDNGGVGVGVGMLNVMKLSDGEPLASGGGDVREDFADFAEDEDYDDLD